jgi:hypothetical protein
MYLKDSMVFLSTEICIRQIYMFLKLHDILSRELIIMLNWSYFNSLYVLMLQPQFKQTLMTAH